MIERIFDARTGITYEANYTPSPNDNAVIPPSLLLKELPPVSLAQMIAALVAYGILTESDGEAWILGALPADVLTVISTLPPEAQFIAKLRAIRPTSVVPTDPLVSALAAMKGKSTEDLIQIFQLAATL